MTHRSNLVEFRRQRSSDASPPRIAALYDAHLHLVYGYCRARLNQHDAEDVTAEVFRTAAERLATDPASSIDAAWLLVSARNRIIDRWRRESRWRSRAPAILSAVEVTQQDTAESLMNTTVVTTALDRLSTDHRMVLVLHYLDDLAVAEIAPLLGRSPRAIESLLARARRALATELRREDDGA